MLTLLDGGAAFTVTDEQVRGMLGLQSNDGISVTVIGSPSDITTTTGFTVRVRPFGTPNNYFVGRTQRDFALTVTRDSIQPSGEVLLSLSNFNLRDIVGSELFFVVESDYLPNNTQSGAPTTPSDYVLTVSVNADIRSLSGVSVIAPLGAGGGSGPDSALLELEFSPPQLWQVSYLPNPNANTNIAPPFHRRPRRNLTPT